MLLLNLFDSALTLRLESDAMLIHLTRLDPEAGPQNIQYLIQVADADRPPM